MAQRNKALGAVDQYLKFVQQSFNTGGPGFTDIVDALNIAADYIEPLIKQHQHNNKITKPQPWDQYTQGVGSTIGSGGSTFGSGGSTIGSGAGVYSGVGSGGQQASTQTVYSEGQQLINKATSLKNMVPSIKIISDPDKYNKFDHLADAINSSDMFSRGGVTDIYKIQDDILDDIYVARDWLKSFQDYQRQLGGFLKSSGSVDVPSLQKELFRLGQSILGRAEELAPYKTGELRRSGVLMVAEGGNQIIIGFVAPYATYVHENLEIKHPYHKSNPDCGGQAKFLEKALQEFFPDRSVWTDIMGVSGVSATISINPLLIEYRHWGS